MKITLIKIGKMFQFLTFLKSTTTNLLMSHILLTNIERGCFVWFSFTV